MVATRRKRAEEGSSSEEEENPQDANFTAQDDGGDDQVVEQESSDDEDENADDGWLFRLAAADAAKKPPGEHAKLLKAFFGAGSAFPRGWDKSKGLPASVKAALKEQEHPFETCPASEGYVLDLAVACKEARLMCPDFCDSYGLLAWLRLVEDFAASQKDTSAGRRRSGQLKNLARAARRLLGVSSEVAKSKAPPAPKVCPLCVATADALLDKYGVDELTFNDYFRLTRAGKVTVINKRKLFRDHLELSTKFRGWLCRFCNTCKMPLLDARTTTEYKLYQGRLYVNCTTFP